MTDWAAARINELHEEGLSGFIFKGGSPSCGLKHVRVFSRQGEEIGYGSGLFAHAFVTRFPHVPVEEEWPLRDSRLRHDFVEQVLSFHDKQRQAPAAVQTADRHSFQELLDRRHTWPCLFPFKFIVPAEKLPDILSLFPEEEPVLRPSKGGKYVSVTIHKHVRSSDDVIACYNRLAGMEGVICL
jgi:putative lipoic acid-binding regulatory protein